MTRSLTGIFLFVIACGFCKAEDPALSDESRPDIPAGYQLLYSQDFEDEAAIQDFEFTDPEKWRLTQKGDNHVLEFLGPGKYRGKVRSPFIIGLLSDREFGDFILEANLLQTGREYGHRDMCLFFGFKDPSNFYYVHIASRADNHAHNIFIVKDAPRTKIAKKSSKGIKWGKDKWHKVRLERRASDGAIKVFFDDMTQPLMVAQDRTFQRGFIGFGSFDDSGMVDNVKIWGPIVVRKNSGFFKTRH